MRNYGSYNTIFNILYKVNYDGFDESITEVELVLSDLFADSYSRSIIFQDFMAVLSGKDIPVENCNFIQWADIASKYVELNSNEKDYWVKEISDYTIEKQKLKETITKLNTVTVEKIDLCETLKKTFLSECNLAFNTDVNDLFLAAIGYTLFEITGSTSDYITIKSNGRYDMSNKINFTRTVGCLTYLYPFKIEIQKHIIETIKTIKEKLTRVPNRGIGYGSFYGINTKNLPKIIFDYFYTNTYDQDEDWNLLKTNDTDSMLNTNSMDNYFMHISSKNSNNKYEIIIHSLLSKEWTKEFRNILEKHLLSVIELTSTIAKTRSYLTLSDISNVISQSYLDKIQEKEDISNVYLANSLQEGFIYHSLYHGNTDDAYITQFVFEYNTSIDSNKLKQAWEYAQIKYPALRLRFAWDEQLVQIIDKKGSLDWRYMDLSGRDNTKTVESLQKDDRKEFYQLDGKSLFRVYLLKQHDSKYSCIFSFHHAILDGWSYTVLLNYVHDTYKQLNDNETIDLSIDVGYLNSQKYLQDHIKENENFWKSYVEKIEEKADFKGVLIVEKRREGVNINNYKYIERQETKKFILNKEVTKSLKFLCETEGVTVNAIIQYVWHVVLHLYGNSKQTVVGATVSGRNIPINDVEKAVGLFINTLPLVVNHDNQDTTVIDAIKQIQADVNEINSKSLTRLASLQKNNERLFDTLYVFENFPHLQDTYKNESLQLSIRNTFGKLDYPLAFVGYENNNEIHGIIYYAAEIVCANVVDDMIEIMKNICEQIMTHSKMTISEMNYLNMHDTDIMIHKWHRSNNYDTEILFHELFEMQVELKPNNIAVVFENRNYTFYEVNSIANQIGHFIREKYCIAPDDLVALYLDRSEFIIIAILAVLKSGAAYIPIDPNFPDQRIQFILKDSKPKLILCDSVYKKKLSDILLSQSVTIQCEDIRQISSSNYLNPTKLCRSDNLSYVIYTSGTTGTPKGCMINHMNVVNFFHSVFQEFRFMKFTQIRTLFYTSYVFDPHVFELCISIFCGNICYIVDNETRKDLVKLEKYISENRIQIATVPSALLNCKAFLNVDVLVFGGDRPNKNIIDFYVKKGVKVKNCYGPTEATVCCSLNHYRNNGESNIGYAINNLKMYGLSDTLKFIPIGAVGELYVGGDGIARGYLNRPDLTAERFIPNPFQTKAEREDKRYGENGRNARIYKTGDLVRRLQLVI